MARAGHDGLIVLASLLNAVPFCEKLGFVVTGRGFSSLGTAKTPPIEVVCMELPTDVPE